MFSYLTRISKNKFNWILGLSEKLEWKINNLYIG